MPKARSAQKQARASERKRIHNQSVKSRIRSGLRSFFQLAKENPTNVREQGRHVVSLLDRAAKTRVLHVNTARRYKTRVMGTMTKSLVAA